MDRTVDAFTHRATCARPQPAGETRPKGQSEEEQVASGTEALHWAREKRAFVEYPVDPWRLSPRAVGERRDRAGRRARLRALVFAIQRLSMDTATPMSVSDSPTRPESVVLRGSDSTGNDSSADLTLLLHPLVVLNISDHYNRFAAMRLFPQKVGHPSADCPAPSELKDLAGNIRVVGLLLGTQDGRFVDVCHSFELLAKPGDAHATDVDTGFMHDRIEQYKQIFPNYHVVGWYSTASVVSEDDIRLHKEVFSVLNESPVMLVVNVDACRASLAARLGVTRSDASAASVRPDRPDVLAGPSSATNTTVASVEPLASSMSRDAITAYQAELHMVGTTPHTVFARVPHRFASADSERISVDHVSRHAVPGGADGSATQHLASLRRSVRMLSARIEVMVQYLDATAAGTVSKDHALLRRVSAVCARLPSMESEQFASAFKGEHFDAMVVNYLCGLTKSICAMNELVETFHFAYDKSSTSGGARRRM